MKDKRKTRLNKTQVTKTEFVGFGAFAKDGTPNGDNSIPKPATMRWSPVYTGNEDRLTSMVFPRLIKRDATTKVKALQELQDYFRREDPPRKQQVDALAHYMFLYHSKLAYESSSSVRAEGLLVLILAANRLPKAFSTLAQQNNQQILGMMYCCLGDPATEVRSMASKTLSETEITAAYSLLDLEVGLWDYVHRIVSYGRPTSMHEDLFAATGSNGSADLNELQKDQLEERFERIVGTALSGMQAWIQKHGILSDNNPHIYNSHSFLWKTLSSPKSSLRHRTYSLFATCCQKAPKIIVNNQQALAQPLSHALSQEKEAGNISALLEALLAFLAAYSNYSSAASPWDTCLNAGAVTKSLIKIFKKSCYGASATQWGPMLLPLLAMLQSLKDQVAVLSAAWLGREQTVRLGDHFVIVETVCESASFFLLRKQNEDSPTAAEQDVSLAKALAHLWIDCLQTFLTATSTKFRASMGGPVQQAHIALGKSLARELRRFSEDRPNCALHPIRDWLWQEHAREVILKDGINDSLAMLVQEMPKTDPAQPSATALASSHLSSILGQKFRTVLNSFQDRSGAVPTMDAYAVMIAILQYCGIHVLDEGESNEANSAQEKFLMNTVLRWMVIHTSSLSTQPQTKALAEKDFILFGICAAVLPTGEARSKLWESCLREVIGAKCRLELLLGGLTALLRQDKIWEEGVQCDLLDQFATQLVREALQQINIAYKAGAEIIEEDNQQKVLTEFLQTCAGLCPGIPLLVRPSVVSTWVDITCDVGDVIAPDSVLQNLMMAAIPPSRLSEIEVQRVVRQSWRQGGKVWTQETKKLLLKESSLLLALFDQAPSILKASLVEWYRKPDDEKADRASLFWSERAWRLLTLIEDAKSCDVPLPAKSLKYVNLADTSLWESNVACDYLFSCLMRLLGNARSHLERLELLQRSDDENAAGFIANMLIAVSGASTEGISAARTSRQNDRCAQLLAALGGRSHLGRNLLGKLLQASVARVAQLVDTGDSERIRKGVAVVSQLCVLMVDKVKPVDILNASDDDDDHLSEEFERGKISKLILTVLGRQTLSALPWSSCIAELVNVVISHSGVGEERGIGSLHYDIFQLVLSVEGRLRKQLSNSGDVNEEEVIQEVWRLSLCCGFGLNTPSYEWDSHLAIETEKITVAILDYYDNQTTSGASSDLCKAVVSWLITAGPALKIDSLQSRSFKQLYKECVSILSMNSTFDEDTLLALRGIHVAQVLCARYNVDAENLGTQAVMRVVAGFLQTWQNARSECGVLGQAFDATCQPIQYLEPVWRNMSHFNDIISFVIAQGGELLVASTSDLVDELVSALFIASKRWYAFRLLDAIARSTQLCADPTPDEETNQRLAQWTKDLDKEAKSELEEDLEIVSEILPHRMMTEMESWDEEEYADTLDDQIIIGRMLVWLSCLQFVDNNVRKHPSNRPSLCAYLDKSGVAESILNQTLLHTGVGTQRSSVASPAVEVEQLLDTEALLKMNLLASLVLFRTVETLPPLARRWWEEECPNVYTGPIRDYIEGQIAPKILEKELERLKFAAIQDPALSALTVTGSVTTREITAMYTQDEIKLRVSILLPSFYPLRNAEVDCSQTLGIPAKRWKLWSLQITMMLNNQGGTLQEALMLWKENVDQEFEGVEPCPVCYSVLHVKTHKLPELECTTCSNRFHTQCLTQWFRSSGKTQCVLCQQPWVGTKVKR